MPETVGSMGLWIGFIALILVLLGIDLYAGEHRETKTFRPRDAMLWSIFWIGLALAFNVWVYFRFGAQTGTEFLTGYLIEKALSVDNIFVFLVIFSYFNVPLEHQRRVLFWGVLGAIVLRAIFIWLGAALLHQFHWIIYVFGAFLIFTGFKILTQKHEEVHPENNPIVRIFRRMVPMANDYHGSHFITRRDGRWLATPLLLVLVVVEATDVIFAVDSIPAIFAVTEDPFIVFTSNIFAILGLRALYFLLAGVVEKFRYLKVGLGLVLAFVGVKMVIAEWYKIPVHISLAVVTSLLGGSVVASLVNPPAEPPLPEPDEDDVAGPWVDDEPAVPKPRPRGHSV